MRQDATTTKSGFVLLRGAGGRDSANQAHPLRLHMPAGLRSIFTVALILIGIVSAPVSCALADGPHSIFVDPVTQKKTIIHIHQTARESLSIATENGEDPPRISGLPESVTVVVALAATLPVFPADEVRESNPPANSKRATPIERNYSPDIPPPRR